VSSLLRLGAEDRDGSDHADEEEDGDEHEHAQAPTWEVRPEAWDHHGRGKREDDERGAREAEANLVAGRESEQDHSGSRSQPVHGIALRDLLAARGAGKARVVARLIRDNRPRSELIWTWRRRRCVSLSCATRFGSFSGLSLRCQSAAGLCILSG